MLYLGLTSFLFLLRFALAGQGTARNQLYFIVLAALFVFSAFRYQVGCDWADIIISIWVQPTSIGHLLQKSESRSGG